MTIAGVAFLDEDHVLALVRGVLSARTGKDWSKVEAFFAPETPGLDEVRAMRETLDLSVVGDLGAATVLISRRAPVTRSLLEASRRARLVQRLGQRSDDIDLAAARERGVLVSCLPRPSLVRTAEHVLLLMLAVVKRLPAAQRAMRSAPAAPSTSDGVAYNWAGLARIGTLDGATLGVVGLGEVGLLVAERARAFGMLVRYTGRARRPAAVETAAGVSFLPLPELLAEADVVTLHVPGVGVDQPVIGSDELAMMRPGAVLINTSRGWLVDEDALFEALADGRLGGAGLDVHRREPRPATDRFHRLDNVVLTPHLAGGSRLGVLTEVRQLLDNIGRVLAGQPPIHGFPVMAR